VKFVENAEKTACLSGGFMSEDKKIKNLKIPLVIFITM